MRSIGVPASKSSTANVSRNLWACPCVTFARSDRNRVRVGIAARHQIGISDRLLRNQHTEQGIFKSNCRRRVIPTVPLSVLSYSICGLGGGPETLWSSSSRVFSWRLCTALSSASVS